MSGRVIVNATFSTGKNANIELTIRNAGSLSERELAGMFPQIESMLRHSLLRIAMERQRSADAEQKTTGEQ